MCSTSIPRDATSVARPVAGHQICGRPNTFVPVDPYRRRVWALKPFNKGLNNFGTITSCICKYNGVPIGSVCKIRISASSLCFRGAKAYFCLMLGRQCAFFYLNHHVVRNFVGDALDLLCGRRKARCLPSGILSKIRSTSSMKPMNFRPFV